MNVFGIGATELVIVLLIMLMVAGPKRMIRWAYVMGVYMGKLREMWQETAAVLKKELAEAGVEPDVVNTLGQMANPRARRSVVSNKLDKLVDEMKKPVEESLKPVEATLKEVGTTPLAPAATVAETDTAAEGLIEDTPAPDSTERYDAWTPG
jgi:sec-independent protein translocase protein TatB